jgi:O-antigen/teichoic acid export membrane protein
MDRGIFNKILKFLLAFSPTIITNYLLIRFFPYTGLGRIIALPMTFFLNILIIIIGLIISRHLKLTYKIILWVLIMLLTVFISVYMFPQEFNPPVIDQILDKVKISVEC